MNKRTRVFVLVASAVVLVGLGSAGVASYVGFANAPGSTSSAEFDYVPASAEVVAFADVRRLMDSEIGRKLQPNLTSPRDAAMNIFAQAGVDLRTDIDTMVMVALPGDGQDGEPLVFARGRFDYLKIEQLAVSHNGKVDHYQGARLVEMEQPAFAVAFLDTGLVAVGRPAAVRLALDTKANPTTAAKENESLTRMIDRVDDQAAWAVAKFDALQKRGPLPPTVVSQLPAITWLAAGGHADHDVAATLYAEAKDAQAAKDLREVIQGLVALVRLQAGQRPGFDELVNSIQLSGEGTGVSVGFSISAEALEKLGLNPFGLGVTVPGAVIGRHPLGPRSPSRQGSSI